MLSQLEASELHPSGALERKHDTVEVEISGIGALRNGVVAESRPGR